MYYFNSDGTIDNVTLAEVIIEIKETANIENNLQTTLNAMQNISFWTSNILGITGFGLESSNSTFRLTDSKGNLDFRYYSNGWKGNQYVKTTNVSNVGKIMKYSGKAISCLDAFYSTVNVVIADNSIDRLNYGSDAAMDLIGLVNPFGMFLSLNYFIQVKNYSTIQEELMRQHLYRDDFIKNGYPYIGHPGISFK